MINYVSEVASLKKRKSYAYRQERKLVLESEVISNPEYINLKQYLEKHEIISEDTFEVDPDIDDATKNIIRYSFHNIYEEAAREWKAISQTDYDQTNCSLCNEPNKIIFYIENKYNGHTLNVGSSCIQYFENYITNDASDESFTEYRKRIEKDKKVVFRKAEFLTEYPEINNILFHIGQTRDNAKILLPKAQYDKLNDFIKQIEMFRTDYFNSKITQGNLKDLHNIIKECDNYIINDVDPWVSNNQGTPFICDLDGKKLLESKKKDSIIEKLRGNGSLFNDETIREFDSPSFFQEQLSTFKERLASCLSYIALDKNNITVYVVLNNRALREVGFTCSISEFMRNFGPCLFNENIKYNLIDCLAIFKFNNDINNIFTFLDVLDSKWSPDYEFLYDEKKFCYIIISYKRESYCIYNNSNAILKVLLPHIINNSNAENTFFSRLQNWEPLNNFDKRYLKELREAKHNEMY